jgi:hypothetical protein
MFKNNRINMIAKELRFSEIKSFEGEEIREVEVIGDDGIILEIFKVTPEVNDETSFRERTGVQLGVSTWL